MTGKSIAHQWITSMKYMEVFWLFVITFNLLMVTTNTRMQARFSFFVKADDGHYTGEVNSKYFGLNLYMKSYFQPLQKGD